MSSFDDYEIIQHTADIGIKVKGRTLPKTIGKSILAMSDLMLGNMKIGSSEEKGFTIEENDLEIALVSILEEVLYIFEYHKFGVSLCSVNIKNNEYRVHLNGAHYNPNKITDGMEIKAVTYHQLKVKRTPDNWIVSVIFDI